jgi:hypothetical protein
MSRPVRWAVFLVSGVGALSLALAVLAPRPPGSGDVVSSAVVVVPCCIVLLLVILYGHGTGCPLCGRWWARTRVETEFVGREVFDRRGVPFGRSLYRTTYQCASCRRRWSTTHTEEYKEPHRERRPRPRP